MDSNGTRFILLDNARDFRSAQRDCSWNARQGALTLTRQDQPRIPLLPRERSLTLWREATPYIEDDHGQIGRLSADRTRLEWSLSWPGAETWEPVRAARDDLAQPAGRAAELTLDPVDAPEGCRFTDLHLGGSGLVALPYSDGHLTHGLLLAHLRLRWQTHCALPFAPLRAWVDGQDRIWVAGDGLLALCRGAPLPQAYLPRADRFEPVEPNPDPLRLRWQQPVPPHGGLMALASDGASLLLLVRDPAAPQAQQLWTRVLSEEPVAPFLVYPLPGKLPLITDIAAVAPGRVVLLAPLLEGPQRAQQRDCPVVQLTLGSSGRRTAELLPERWPRRSEASVRFVRHRDNGVRTLTQDGVTPLYALAQARFAHTGTVELSLPLDSGTPGTVWHRLYLEACIPPGCQIEIAARAQDVDPDPAPPPWQVQPAPLWLPTPSELPYARGSVAPVPEREGLFEILLQRGDGAVRELGGRYLRLRLTLRGDGRHTPAIHALRAWYPRYSWQAKHLPPHFHQQEPPDATAGSANPADQRERLLAVFEGLLTPIEDRIAAAETLLYPEATPAPMLPWLAQMTAAPLPPHWPESRQRRWLAQQPQLQRRHGTYAGLCQALDIVTDGAVARGEVVPVEMFRLRRTFSTLLGISMDDRAHPLTLGSGQSGNSLVGESLVLGEDQAREFLALLAPELAASSADRAAVERFFDRYARRLTVVLHGAARPLRTLVAEALPRLVPAIVQWQLLETDHPFVLGLSPLLQIDTYLEPTPPPGRVQLDRTRLGRGHLLRNPVALSPEHARPLDPDARGGARP